MFGKIKLFFIYNVYRSLYLEKLCTLTYVKIDIDVDYWINVFTPPPPASKYLHIEEISNKKEKIK